MNRILLCLISVLYVSSLKGQSVDSTEQHTKYNASIGFTTNGISIIPSFSFNMPTSIFLFSWRKNKFSIDPDIRFAYNFRKGGMMVWFRYHAIEKAKFSLRVGIHPAANMMPRTIIENNVPFEVIQFRRFAGGEISPNYQVTKKFAMGVYYLQGRGFQKDGPQISNFLTLNATISNIKLTKNFEFFLMPSVYYLNVDGTEGTYFTATGVLSHVKSRFTLQSTINQTFKSNIQGNQDFMWNITLMYNWDRTLKKVNDK